MEFFSVKHRRKVEVPETQMKKKVFEVKGKGGNMMTRYAVVATSVVDGDTVNLTKFVSKDTYDTLTCPVA